MKKLAAILICISMAVLSGCSLYDEKYGDDVSAFIDPYEEAEGFDFLPEENAVSGSVTEVPQENTTENPPSTYGTFDVAPKIVGENLIGKGFRFALPYPWTSENLAVTVTNANDEGYDISTYTFYYVEPDGDRAVMLALEAVPENYFYLNLAKNADSIGASSDKSTVFMLVRQTSSLPANFGDLDTYLEIYEKMTNTSITIL